MNDVRIIRRSAKGPSSRPDRGPPTAAGRPGGRRGPPDGMACLDPGDLLVQHVRGPAHPHLQAAGRCRDRAGGIGPRVTSRAQRLVRRHVEGTKGMAGRGQLGQPSGPSYRARIPRPAARRLRSDRRLLARCGDAASGICHLADRSPRCGSRPIQPAPGRKSSAQAWRSAMSSSGPSASGSVPS